MKTAPPVAAPVIQAPASGESRMLWLVRAVAIAFAVAVFWESASRWAAFQYRAFDLAFYIQALWKLSHGHAGAVSLLNVPLLGEHANVIVLFLIPLFALAPHPLLPVAVQTLAIASMAPTGYRIARRAGLAPEPAGLLALATLLAPAMGFVALHEFHPEAFAAPFLLLAIDAFEARSFRRYWFWFLAVLACKENMTLLLAAWCAANAFTGWRKGRDRRWMLNWTFWPGVAALGWAALYAGVLGPRWNAGNIDFTGLYGHLEVPWREFPQVLFSHLGRSLRGDLLPWLLLPLCGLPLLRPRWGFVALPVLAQHYFSVRPSEWQIEFHYAAPLAPLFWMAACESIARFPRPQTRKALAVAVAAACVANQAWIGPFRFGASPEPGPQPDLAAQRAAVASVPAEASVVAGLPYLSHLAKREELISLHHLLKGLKTLSRHEWEMPPPTDVVIVDYADTATFNAVAGYYHPDMRVLGGLQVPSSDRLLHAFLRRASWKVEARDAITVFLRTEAEASPAMEKAPAGEGLSLAPSTRLVSIQARLHPSGSLAVSSAWRFSGERKIVPWMALRLTPVQGGPSTWIERGLCAPEGWDNGALWKDDWVATLPRFVPPGNYRSEAVFFDKPSLDWAQIHDPGAPRKPLGQVDLGALRVR